MTKKSINNVKLGGFVLGGVVFLVLLLYMIGKNQHLFGDTYLLKARFGNIQGLVVGNNVRYAGIETGTVSEIYIVNDTTIEVSMLIDKKMQGIIRANAIVSVGTEGFVGNKVVNINPARQPASLAAAGDVLVSRSSVNTDEMIQTLSNTNKDIAIVASELKHTIQRINSSTALWDLLNDRSLPQGIGMAVANVRSATGRADQAVQDIQLMIRDIKMGKGSAGMLLKDSSFALQLNDAVSRINAAAGQTDSLVIELQQTVAGIRGDIDTGRGVANALFKDSVGVKKVTGILENIQNGTDGFNQNMEALKHNFLFRGYFKKLEKQRQKEEKEKAKAAAGGIKVKTAL
ncbi:MAG: MCE family protein [Chitinophagaceae bacterium]|nr:MCE family protein [Chitinophagaceae bacterium]